MPMRIRPIRIEGNIAYVTLTKGNEAIIDAESAALVCMHNWYSKPDKHTSYAIRNETFGDRQIKIAMHRLIMQAKDGIFVDHINGNGVDNRKENLRLATRGENARNQRISVANTSGFKGVSWDKKTDTWQAAIMVNSKTVFLGRFPVLQDACSAYRLASADLHGDFGRV